jgi:hypothetical protein
MIHKVFKYFEIKQETEKPDISDKLGCTYTLYNPLNNSFKCFSVRRLTYKVKM